MKVYKLVRNFFDGDGEPRTEILSLHKSPDTAYRKGIRIAKIERVLDEHSLKRTHNPQATAYEYGEKVPESAANTNNYNDACYYTVEDERVVE